MGLVGGSGGGGRMQVVCVCVCGRRWGGTKEDKTTRNKGQEGGQGVTEREGWGGVGWGGRAGGVLATWGGAILKPNSFLKQCCNAPALKIGGGVFRVLQIW